MANESMCPAPDCARLGNYCRGLCLKHYAAWRKACRENGSLGRGDAELPRPVISHWTYENPAGEAELAEIAQLEKEEREKNK